MIMTYTEVKDFLGITDTTYDNQIIAQLPGVQDEIVEYTNNVFRDWNTSYISGSISLVNATPATITDSESRFVIEGFESGMDIAVEGTFRNRGIYLIGTVVAGTITLIDGYELLNESSTDEFGGNQIRLSRVAWPAGLKKYCAQMVWENISNIKNGNIKSRTIGPTSITYMQNTKGYSDSILSGLNKYKILRMK